MKIVKEKDALKINNSNRCSVLEYPLDDLDINCAVATIIGKYPETGYCMNEKCKEVIYGVEGDGTLNKKNQSIHFEQGDVILIDKGEAYYWDGDCTIVMPCTPAWYPEQYKLID